MGRPVLSADPGQLSHLSGNGHGAWDRPGFRSVHVPAVSPLKRQESDAVLYRPHYSGHLWSGNSLIPWLIKRFPLEFISQCKKTPAKPIPRLCRVKGKEARK